jgi:5'-deoxynucleotidase YfbR-like HD superfamily hydrolase
VKTKAPLGLEELRERRPALDLPPLIEAYFELNHLKQLYRQGWLRRGIPPERCESVAEHVFAMTMLGWWIVDAHFPGLNRDTVIRMTLVHEIGEVYVGDLTPGDRVPPEEKHRLEREALWQVVGKLPKGTEYLALWEEFEQGHTPEAQFVRQMDRLEMAFQAAVYQQQGFEGLGEFFASTDAALTNPVLRDIFAELETFLRHI